MPKPLDPPRDHRIQLPEAAEFTRRWLIVTRKEGDRWRVSNFTEYD